MNNENKITAKQMFMDLGYGHKDDKDKICYYKLMQCGIYRELYFFKKDGVITINYKDKLPWPDAINIKDLLAIIEQAKEYGWIGEEDDNN